MQRILAIAWLTWKAALRFKLFLVIAVLLFGAVVGLPLLIQDDGTARGFTQIILTYTLSAITALLGLSTLWLACGTLARDIEECQMQVVATKPIARWQIWIGKWLGIVSLNAVLLAFFRRLRLWPVAMARRQTARRRAADFTRAGAGGARGGAGEGFFSGHQRGGETGVAGAFEKQPGDDGGLAGGGEANSRAGQGGVCRSCRRDTARARGRLTWVFAKNYLRDQPLQVRVKFNAANHSTSGTFVLAWLVGDPNSKQIWQSQPMSLAPDTVHEFQIPPNLFDTNGVLTIVAANLSDTALLFPLEDGMEVLYPEGGFALNFVRGLGIIFCWMALLAALGLAAASFLSFPVAAFFSLAMLLVILSGGTLADAVESGTVVGATRRPG